MRYSSSSSSKDAYRFEQLFTGAIALAIALFGITLAAFVSNSTGVLDVVIVGSLCGMVGGYRAARAGAFIGSILGMTIAGLLFFHWSSEPLWLSLPIVIAVMSVGFWPGTFAGGWLRPAT